MRKYVRFVLGLRKYLKERIDPLEALDRARNLLKERIVSREKNFLNIVEKGVFNYSRSPYLKLLSRR